jgi:ATP-dependent Clp protease adaptor protein ClpS
MQQEESRTRFLPPYAVIVFNDDYHTYQYVVECFARVFGYSQEKSFLLAKEIHVRGLGIVWSGSKEVAELKREQIEGMGPDLYAARRIDWPLRVELEPLL